MDSTVPTPGNSPALDYERAGAEPVQGVWRDGISLVCRPGADFSRFCICCGKPASGKSIRKHLMKSTGSSGTFWDAGAMEGWLGAIFLFIFILVLVIDFISIVVAFQESRRRTVTFGLCQQHGLRRRNLMAVAWSLAAGGFVCLGGGILLAATNYVPGYESALWIGGLILAGLLWLAGGIVGSFLNKVRLQKESAGQLWLRGAGEGFLQAQASLSGQPA